VNHLTLEGDGMATIGEPVREVEAPAPAETPVPVEPSREPVKVPG
jgi:hypothetical protein